MKSYTLDIAGYRILFQAKGEELRLMPGRAQQSFLVSGNLFDIAINVYTGTFKVPASAEKVFMAPYVEEINGMPVKKSDKFWTVYKHGDYILVHTSMPLSETISEALLTIRPGEKAWDLVMDTAADDIDPLTYPVDGLLLYYLTALNGDIFIHGSGVQLNGKAYIFSGMSGRGKTTMARLFNKAGATVIHDDRLIIRKHDGSFFMHNTPVYHNERRSLSEINAIYLIEHSSSNNSTLLNKLDALTALMSNCIQHHWNPQLISLLSGSLMDLCDNIKVKRLGFVPDQSVIDFILNDE
jgi:hypothetical protein